MNHQPFENWLLDDEHLSTVQRRELHAHLRECVKCSTLAEVNLALRSTPVARPTAGFVTRFQVRLATEQKAQRRRSLIGLSVLTVSVLAGLLWLFLPDFMHGVTSPSSLLATWTGHLVFWATLLQVLGEISPILWHVASNFVPGFVWLIVLYAFGGVGLLWAFSLWQVLRRAPQQI